MTKFEKADRMLKLEQRVEYLEGVVKGMIKELNKQTTPKYVETKNGHRLVKECLPNFSCSNFYKSFIDE